MSRAKGARKPCDAQQARQRLVDARQFLEAAKLLDAPDVVATCAIHAAIAASSGPASCWQQRRLASRCDMREQPA